MNFVFISFNKTGKLWLYFKSKADKSSSFCLVIPFQPLTVPECRPEGCLSNHSGTRGCTWLCNYSAPALIKACNTFRNIVSYAEYADILGQQMAHWGFKGTFSHFSLPLCANKTTHIHQQPQSDVILHSTLLSRSGRQVWEPGQRHPVLVEIRVQRLKKFQLVRCHKSCTKIRQSAPTWMDGCNRELWYIYIFLDCCFPMSQRMASLLADVKKKMKSMHALCVLCLLDFNSSWLNCFTFFLSIIRASKSKK